jgi:hypothetical protein
MERMTAALESAGSLAALLDAAWDAFELIISASGDYADTDEGFFAALVYVLAAAADGRDAIITAPSLPARPPQSQPAGPGHPDPGRSALDVAASLASLSGVLADRLTSAAGPAGDPRDRAACVTGARHAREIHVLLAGTQS